MLRDLPPDCGWPRWWRGHGPQAATRRGGAAAPRTMERSSASIRHVERTDGRRAEAAQALGIGLRTLQRSRRIKAQATPE
jgi:hypothetical protein